MLELTRSSWQATTSRLNRLGRRLRSARPSGAVLEGLACWGVVLFAVAQRLLVLPLPTWNVDATRKWLWARTVLHGWSPIGALWGKDWDHHMARFAITLPTLAAQWLFGDDAWVYYVTPLLALAVGTGCLFHIARRVGGVGFAIWTCAAWAWLTPSGWQVQLMPSAFSTAYVLAATLCAIRIGEAESGRARAGWIAGASACLMLAELTKVTNLFFVPGLLLGLWLSTRRLGVVLGLAAALGGWLGAEWLGYQLSPLEAPLGRFSVITSNHFQDLEKWQKEIDLEGWWDFISRQEPVFERSMPGLWLWLSLPVMLVGVWRFQRLPLALKLLLPSALGFLLLHVFAIRSLDPLLPAQRAQARYVAALVPITILLVLWALSRLLGLAPGSPTKSSRHLAAHGAGLLMLLSYRYIFDFGGYEQHAFSRLAAFQELAEGAYDEGTPIVARSGSRAALRPYLTYFWNGFELPYYRQHPEVPQPHKTTRRGRRFRYLIHPDREQGKSRRELERSLRGGKALLVKHRITKISMRARSFDSLR